MAGSRNEVCAGGGGREVVWRRVSGPASIVGLRLAVARRPGGFVLESGGPDGGYSYFGYEPQRVVEVPAGVDPWPVLGELWGTGGGGPEAVAARPAPFAGGWVGFIAYESGGFVEPTAAAADRWLTPAARFGLYPAVIVFDPAAGAWSVAGSAARGERAALEARLDELERTLRGCGAGEAAQAAVGPAPRVTCDLPRAAYMAGVERILEYIRAGDVYQVNLARRLVAHGAFDARALFQRLAETNPAAYSAYLSCGAELSVVSSSPELFLEVSRDDAGWRCESRPIKGTRRRSGDVAADGRAAAELAASEKDDAELAMIVDLVRNDLGRVCAYGSVQVEDAGSIEWLPTVIQRVATVSGRLRAGAGAWALLRAAFPGGSVTGAPKVRAMQIINELERSARGVYCGAVGYVALDGRACLNLAIRTLMVTPRAALVSVGAGIVADSDPAAEYDETRAKAAALLRALGADEP
ncbi:MAG: anthranilate synthase component I family protein [Phycisphaerae bacterium]